MKSRRIDFSRLIVYVALLIFCLSILYLGYQFISWLILEYVIPASRWLWGHKIVRVAVYVQPLVFLGYCYIKQIGFFKSIAAYRQEGRKKDWED